MEQLGSKGNILISVGIPIDAYKMVKDKGWSHREIYCLGIRAKEENPQLLERMREYEENTKRIAQKLEYYARRCQDLDMELDNIKRGTGKC